MEERHVKPIDKQEFSQVLITAVGTLTVLVADVIMPFAPAKK